MNAEEDGVLVRRCLEGDSAAFRPLVERYQRVLFTVAVRMLGDRDQAVDAAQDAFIRAYQKLATYDSEHKFFSWLYRILVNECLNVRRARRPNEPLSDTLQAPDDPEETARRSELRAWLQSALLELPPEQREVVVLRHYADMSYLEMAATLGIQEKTVKSRLYSARQRLAEMLAGWEGGQK